MPTLQDADADQPPEEADGHVPRDRRQPRAAVRQHLPAGAQRAAVRRDEDAAAESGVDQVQEGRQQEGLSGREAESE